MTDKKENPRWQPGTGESSWNSATHGYDGNTPRCLPLSKKARRLIHNLAPWDSWLLHVVPAPESFPGAVKTMCCPFCNGVHIFQGRVSEDDAGIRPLPCDHAALKPKWQIPPVPTQAIIVEVHDD